MWSIGTIGQELFWRVRHGSSCIVIERDFGKGGWSEGQMKHRRGTSEEVEVINAL